MANITEDTPAAYAAGVYQIEDGDPATGGPDGITVLPAKQLANRTKWLKEQVDAILAELGLNATLGPELPIAAVPYPTIGTATNKLAVGTGSGTNGGTVDIAAGQRLTVGMEVEAGETARLGAWETAEWESADLDVSSTYYLRAQITDGDLVLYTAKGADNDAIPAGLKGTPDAGSGGGFDSTQIDCLIAKVVTGTAGSTPTVTTLANAAYLVDVHVYDAIPSNPALNIWVHGTTQTLNWARTPSLYPVDGNIWETGNNGIINHANTVVTASDTVSRYARASAIQTQFDAAPTTPYGWIRLHTSA